MMLQCRLIAVWVNRSHLDVPARDDLVLAVGKRTFDRADWLVDGQVRNGFGIHDIPKPMRLSMETLRDLAAIFGGRRQDKARGQIDGGW